MQIRRPFSLLAVVVLMLMCGCTYQFHEVSADVSPSFAEFNKGIHRVAIGHFSFDRPSEETIQNTRHVRPANAGEIVADAVGRLPFKLGYEIVERQQLETVLSELKLSQSDLLRPKTATRVGELLGVQAVILGVVNEYKNWEGGPAWGFEISYSARMVRLDTGQVLWTTICGHGGQENYTWILRTLVDQLADKLEEQGATRTPPGQ